MKIVFESEEEKEQFISSKCPHEIGLCIPSPERCKACWDEHVKMEVESNEQINTER